MSEGGEGRIACRASGGMARCEWRKEGRRVVEYDSDMEYDMRDNVVVRISRSSGGEEDNMCFLTIRKVEMLHAGMWSCHVYRNCHDMHEYDVSEKLVMKQGSSCNKDRSHDINCEGNATEIVKLEVVDDDTIGLVAAQELYVADLGCEVSLLVRTNEEFGKCGAF